MASGPYQSNLLRFLISQYRDGLDRHHRAVRQTRSAIEYGGELSTAVALMPVYAVVRASQAIRQTLSQSVTKLRLSAARRKVNKLIDFSGFEPLSSKPVSSQPANGAVSSTARSVSGDRTQASALAVLNCELAEASMVETLVAVSEILLPAQIKSLAKPSAAGLSAGVSESVSWGWGLVRRLVGRLTKTVETMSELASVTSADRENQLITGVASDLETRSLVLILDYKIVWNQLSAAQQVKLNDRIINIRKKVPKNVVQSLSAWNDNPPQSSLVHPIQSFWIAVLKVLAELRQGHFVQKVALLSPGLAALPNNQSTVRLASDEVLQLMGGDSSPTFNSRRVAQTVVDRVLPSVKRAWPKVLTVPNDFDGRRLLVSEVNEYIEADVISIDYVEHPLEKLLKWVDKIFLWLEKAWQKIGDWCRENFQ